MPDTAPAAPQTGLAVLADRIGRLRGWRRFATAVCCGVLACVALPPLYILPLLLPAFTGLLWLLSGVTKGRQAALLGWSFGFGYFFPGVYWVGIAFLVDAERFAWAMPFAVAGLAALLAVFSALAVYLVHVSGFRGISRIFVLAAAWLLGEWLRSWVFSGFPWNLLGIVWSFAPEALQLAAFTGVWGLSMVTVLAASAPALLAEPAGRPAARRSRALAAALLTLPVLVWLGGSLRLALAPEPGSRVQEGVRLRIVQPAIDQKLKWRRDLRRDHVVLQMGMTAEPGFEAVTHAIWAETAVPFYLSEDADLRRFLARIIPPGGLLLTGAPRWSASPEASGPWNSFHALDAFGEIVGTFDKFHLVPFGEYVPFRALLGLVKLTVGDRDFQAGNGPATLKLPGLPPVSPLICYEVIFPGAVTARGAAPKDRPRWLLNITNDAWFGTSSGPYQHFANARLRAVEEGLPLVRAANSGISGVIDGYGRVIARLGLNRVGILDSELPVPVDPMPLFARLGNWAAAILGLLAALMAYLLRRVP